jgi:acetyl esterase/lipase
VVVWIHGGAWLFGDRRHIPESLPPDSIFEQLLAAGVAVATVDYRLSGEARFPGESAGGHLAALVGLTSGRPELDGSVGVTGSNDRVTAVVDWYGIADLAPMAAYFGTDEPNLVELFLGGLSVEAMNAASPITYATAEAPPSLLIHGTADQVVPIEQSQALDAALRKAGADSRLLPVDGADHIFIGAADIPGLIAHSIAFLRERLGATG